MISCNFVLFWAGANLSYLRYLTFKTLRIHHLNSKIQLFTVQQFTTDNHKWDNEKQDFENPIMTKDYMPLLKDLNVEIITLDYFCNKDYHPVYQSDLFRWWWLTEASDNGGFYLDTDQLILKPFDTLPLDREFIFSAYPDPTVGTYAPVGVLGLAKGSSIGKHMMKVVPKHYKDNNYNSSGPFMLMRELYNVDLSNSFNSPSSYFYPIPNSNGVVDLYNGSFEISNKSYAAHLYGGHPLTQEFNAKYTEEFAKTSNDSISRYLRHNSLI